jgi:hypothetical protein
VGYIQNFKAMSLLVKTDRLELRPFTPGDEKRFLQLNTYAHIRRFLWDDGIIDESLAKEIIRKNEAHFRQDKFGIWKVHHSKRMKKSLVLWDCGIFLMRHSHS